MTTATGTALPATVATFVRFLETGEPGALFAPDAFGDISLPQWRVQVGSADELVAMRLAEHPGPGEMFRADVVDGRIVDLAGYCTGDWDEARQRAHAEQVRLLRP